MCDTVVAVGNSTKDGSVIFGKNSDREPNEVHNIVLLPREKFKPNSKVKCTHISIPQVEETYQTLLMKPFWMFGCEMGTNEFGVTIGNEAVYSKEPYRKTGLLGMDLITLALQRSKTAKEGLEVIISLLKEHGQGGNCGYLGKEFYHNSFIIADLEEAWVLETADKFWIAEKVKSIRSISNSLSIRKEYDLIHPNLIQHALKKGYCKSEEDFDFAKNFIPKLNIYQIFAKGKTRQACMTDLLQQSKGKITPETIMSILRNHNISASKERRWIPQKSSFRSICIHYNSYINRSQSVGSQVAHLKKEVQVHWVTGTSAPCTSTFKPIFLPNAGIDEIGGLADFQYNPKTLWWHHEKLHRLVLQDYKKRLNSYKMERNELEKIFINQTNDLLSKISSTPSNNEIQKMKNITKEAFMESRKKTEEWINRVKILSKETKLNPFYSRRWKQLNKYVKLDFQ